MPALVLVLVSSGCGRLEVESSPDTFPVPDEAASQLWGAGQFLTLENVYGEPTVVRVSEFGSGVDADLHQYTQTAITLAQRALTKQAFYVQPGSEKTVTLKVSDVTYNYGWTITYGLSLEASLGDGGKTVVRAENSSPATAYRAVDGAIMRAVTKLMHDERFQNYLNE